MKSTSYPTALKRGLIVGLELQTLFLLFSVIVISPVVSADDGVSKGEPFTKKVSENSDPIMLEFDGTASREEVEGRIEKTLDSLRELGRYYVTATLKSSLKVGEDVRYRYLIEPGPQVAIEKLEFNGANRTNHKLLNDLANIKRGALLSPAALTRASEALSRYDFISVRGDPQAFANDNLASATVRFLRREEPTFKADGAFGYDPSGEGSFVGSLNLGLTNFLGGGRRALLEIDRRNRERSSVSITYIQPTTWLGVGTSSIRIHTRDFSSEFYEFGFAMSLNKYLSPVLSFETNVSFKNTQPALSERAPYNSYTFGFVGEYKHRDSRSLGRQPRGNSALLRWSASYVRREATRNTNSASISDIETSATQSESSNDLRLSAEFRKRKTIGASLSVVTSIAIAQILSENKSLPLAEKYLVGGSNYLRGYRANQFAVEKFAAVSAQPEILLGEGAVYPFIDYALLYDSGAKSEKFGYGMGFRLKTQERFLTLELGWGERFSFDDAWLTIQLHDYFSN